MKKILIQNISIVQQKIKNYSTKVILCGISNGQDSVLLFLILLHLKKLFSFQIKLIYCHHFWNSENFIGFWQILKIGFLLKIPFIIIFSETSLVNENQARVWRKHSIDRVAFIEKADHLILGHTLTDKIETGFWHLIRGTSINGLTSLKLKTTRTRNPLCRQFPIDFQTRKKIRVDEQNTKKRAQKSQFLKSKPVFNFLILTNKQKRKNLCQKSVDNNLCLVKDLNNEKIFVKYFFNFCSQDIKQNYFHSLKQDSFSIFLKFKKTQRCLLILKRPLLNYHRTHILKVVENFRFPLVNDKTNKRFNFARNKIRYKILPLIRIYFCRDFDFVIKNFFELSQSDQDYFETNLNKFISFLKFKYFLETKKFGLRINSNYQQTPNLHYFNKRKAISTKNFFDKKVFIKLDVSLQRTIIKNFYSIYSSNSLSFLQIETLRSSIVLLQKTNFLTPNIFL
jgi:tRNA(Ile)-lysidine synthase TilS/MesJ